MRVSLGFTRLCGGDSLGDDRGWLNKMWDFIPSALSRDGMTSCGEQRERQRRLLRGWGAVLHPTLRDEAAKDGAPGVLRLVEEVKANANAKLCLARFRS